MKKTKISFMLIIMSIFSIKVSAYDIAVENADGKTIYYNYINNGLELEVTFLNQVYDKNQNAYSGSINLPEEVTYMNRSRKVTSIGDGAFANCKGLTNLIIPNSIVKIGRHAFYGCNFESLLIPDYLTTIGPGAFQYCSNLISINIPENVKEIGTGAFGSCSSLESVHISNIDAWCRIRFNAKNANTNPLSCAHHLYLNGKLVTDVVFPEDITSISETVFEGCSDLISIKLPNDVVSIGHSAFKDCCNLVSINIPESVTSIGYSAFRGCSNLSYIKIPDALTFLGDGAFAGCKNLPSINIPASISSIDHETFEGCIGISSVIIPENIKNIGFYAFRGCTGLSSLILSEGLTSIDQGAFEDCTALSSIILPKSLTSIGHSAFNNVNWDNIISKIENPSPIYGKSEPRFSTFNDNTFMNATLYVPKGTLSTYKETEGWKDFVFIEESSGEKCAIPTISYNDGKLTFKSETEGAVCNYYITDSDIKVGRGNEVQLEATYYINVYATLDGYENSDIATATLCWIDKEPIAEGISSETISLSAKAFLLQFIDGNVYVQGAKDGELIRIYNTSGVYIGSAISKGGKAIINIPSTPDSIAIVKSDNKCFKLLLK